MGLVTIDEVIPFVNQNNPGDVTNDQKVVLSSLISKISKRFDGYLGRTLESASHTEYYEGNGLNRLKLNNFPITSVTHLYEDTTRGFDTSSELTSGSDFFIYNNKYIQLVSTYFSVGISSIKIVYVAGYSTSNVPQDLKYACITEVLRNYKNVYMSGGVGVNGITTPNGTTYNLVTLPFLEETKQVLDSYML